MKQIYIAIGIIGFVLMFGAAGASDMEIISFGEVVARLIGALIMIMVSIIGIKRYDRKIEAANRNKIEHHSHASDEYDYSVCGFCNPHV